MAVHALKVGSDGTWEERYRANSEGGGEAHLHGPLWQGAGHLWLPQRSLLPHTSSHGGQLPSQQRRLQGWRPHARMAAQRRSQVNSWKHRTSLELRPHLHTISRPMQLLSQAWPHS